MKRGTIAMAALVLGTGGAAAQDCPSEGDPYDLDAPQVEALYECIEATMAEQYAAEGDEVGSSYRDWQVTSTRPAVAGPHDERFLQTFANDVAAEQYLKFEEEVDQMPEGSILAKESFALRGGAAQVGPLFIMTKLPEGEAPDHGDWFYAALQPNGQAMNVGQGFCSGCHLNWDYRDSVAYPLEEVRLAN